MWQKIKNIYHLFWAFAANLYYCFPAKDLTVIGITGTDGKTTVACLIYEILKRAGKKTGLVSSVKTKIDGEEFETGFHVTTPESRLLQKIVRHIVNRGGEYLVLETTSHALDQHRVFGIPFEIAVLTNVTREHLDYHQNYDQYLKTKLKLLKKANIAIVNQEDGSFKKINHQLKTGNLVTYGLKKGDINSKTFKFSSLLTGDYNRYNCLAAIAAAKKIGIADKTIRQVLSEFKGVDGRLEFIDTGRDFQVMIDFAHTPNGLKNVLETIRPKASGRLIHVFGCAGLRDKKKRPIMGQISAQYADIIILTEEDFRTEDVNQINNQIISGIHKQSKVSNQKPQLLKFSHRQRAITKAVSLARKGDFVLLTGKGCERSLCRGKKEHPWSEKKAVKKALKALSQ